MLRPHKRKLVTTHREKTERSSERGRKKEARVEDEFQTEEYNALDKLMVIKKKEVERLVGIPVLSRVT